MSKGHVVNEITNASNEFVEHLFTIFDNETADAHGIVGKVAAYADFFVQAIDLTIAYVEKISEYFKDATGKPLSADDKLEIAATLLDKAIKLPIPLEVVDGTIIKLILSYTVKKYNRDIGHGWIEKVWGIVSNDVAPYLQSIHGVIDQLQSTVGE